MTETLVLTNSRWESSYNIFINVIMETIFGLLFILLPVVFKLIGKRMEQAGKIQQHPDLSEEQEPVEDWQETLRKYLEQQTAVEPLTPEPLTPEPMVKDSVEARETPKKAQKPKKVTKKTPILVEEEKKPKEKKPKEKIDVKKLIVYSEIMKPKYTE